MNTTIIMRDEIARAAKEDDSHSFLALYDSCHSRYDKKHTQQWQAYYGRLSYGFSAGAIAGRCGCALNTVKKWSSSIPCRREYFVMIGCCFGLSPDEVSKLMAGYGGFSGLCSDNIEDIRYIRLLQIMRDDLSGGEGLFNVPSSYERLGNAYYAEANRIKTIGLWTGSRYDMAKGSLLKEPDPLFYEMIEKSRSAASSSYHKVSGALVGWMKNIGFSSNTAFYEKTKMSSSMQRIFSGMSRESKVSPRQKDLSPKPMPWRRQLIVFCLYLGMPLDHINSLLKTANMEALYPRDPFEAALLFVLQQLYHKDRRFAGRTMQGEKNMEMQEDLQYLHNNGYFGLFGYVYARLSQGELAAFLEKMDVDLKKSMCLSAHEGSRTEGKEYNDQN